MEIFRKLRVQPKNYDLYDTARTHPSYAHANRLKTDYNRLEFVGDAIISKLVAVYLYERKVPDEDAMTNARKAMVQQATLARACNEAGIAEDVLLGPNTQLTESIAADVFEAFCGALYFDHGERKVLEFLKMTIFKYYEGDDLHQTADYKTRLQEFLQAQGHRLEYRQEGSTDGPERSVAVGVYSNGQCYGKGSGPNKRVAEQQAAREALQRMGAAGVK